MKPKTRYLSLKEVSAQYSFTVRTLRSWIFRGKLKASKIGHEWRIAESEMERVIQEAEYKPVKISLLF